MTLALFVSLKCPLAYKMNACRLYKDRWFYGAILSSRQVHPDKTSFSLKTDTHTAACPSTASFFLVDLIHAAVWWKPYSCNQSYSNKFHVHIIYCKDSRLWLVFLYLLDWAIETKSWSWKPLIVPLTLCLWLLFYFLHGYRLKAFHLCVFKFAIYNPIETNITKNVAHFPWWSESC